MELGPKKKKKAARHKGEKFLKTTHQRNCRDLPTGKWQFGHRCTVSLSSGMRNGTKLQAQSPTRQQHAAARMGIFEHGS